MGQSICGGCFGGLAVTAKTPASTPAVAPPSAKAPAAKAPENKVLAPTAPSEETSGGEEVCRWNPGEQGVVDISPEAGSQKLLLREAPGAPQKAQTPSDGAQVTLELEAFCVKPDGSSPELCFSKRRLQLEPASGDVNLPEELELVIPVLKEGFPVEVLCCKFGDFGAMPETPPWSELSSCCGGPVLLKIELIEAQDLCLATLEAAERLEYAKSRKDAGGRYFKRGRYESALERYSLASEMLGHTDDIKDARLNLQAKEVKGLSELNAAACLLKLEKNREAEDVCSSLLRQNPDNEKARFRRAKALLAQGDGARAQGDLRKILEVNPGNAEAKQLLQQARREAQGTDRERKVYAKMLG